TEEGRERGDEGRCAPRLQVPPDVRDGPGNGAVRVSALVSRLSSPVSLFPVPRSRLTLKAMTPSDPVHATPDTAPDAVPDYVRVLEQAAGYLPPEQLVVLRRAWAIGA